ncbi:MAG: hypothetical protein KY467_05915 [Gemmatimonadetes bacterium]|nr:hypothetical protein [Gemmatimonadota bacterium]
MYRPPHSDRPLPEMVGDAAPEHDLRGRIIVRVMYGCGVLAWATLPFAENATWGERLALFVGGALVFAWTALIAGAVERFACWSWFFVVGWFVLLLLGALDTLSYEHRTRGEAGSACAAALVLLSALHYLWLRRWDFWADARLEARCVVRRVTPEWRRARLARMRAAPQRLPGGSPRPGELWLSRASPPLPRRQA